MKNQYQLKQSVPYETIKNLNWAIKNKELVAAYEKLLMNKKILYLLSIEKTAREIGKLTEQKTSKVERLINEMCRASGCKWKLGLIQIAYRLNIIK